MIGSIQKSAFAEQLLDVLANRSSPLLIELEDHGVIVARRFDYAGPFSLSVTSPHPEGDIIIGSNWPSRAVMDGLSHDQLANMSYAELADSTCDSRGCEWRQLDECPWLTPTDNEVAECFDVDGHFIKDTPPLRARLIQWLSEEDEEAPDIDALFPELHEGLVGYAIRDGLPDAEVKRLSLITCGATIRLRVLRQSG